MCIVEDSPNDPQTPHTHHVEPGRNGTTASVEQLVKNLKYFWFLVVPLTMWAWRVEGFIQKGDRQTASMSLQQHKEMTMVFDEKLSELPPQLYRDYIDAQFSHLHDRLDFIEALITENK